MPKLKIVEPGYETITGSFGGYEFVNGQSVEEVGAKDCDRIAAIVTVVAVDEEAQTTSRIGIGHRLVEHARDAFAPATELVTAKSDPVETPADADTGLTRAQLEAIADARGIEGLREIAEPMGLRDRSIAGLIDQILARKVI